MFNFDIQVEVDQVKNTRITTNKLFYSQIKNENEDN